MFKQMVRQYLDRIFNTFKSSDAREKSYYTILEGLINEYVFRLVAIAKGK